MSGAWGVSPPYLVCWNAPPKRAGKVRLCCGMGVTFLRASRLSLLAWPVLLGRGRQDEHTTPDPPGAQQRSTWGDNNVTL